MNEIKVGSKHQTLSHGSLIVDRIVNSREVHVTFTDTGFKTVCQAVSIRKGEVKDYLYPRLCGVGYIGVGEYKSTINGRRTKHYAAWKGMIERCYLKESKYYLDCTVCDEWLCLQEFSKWFYDNLIPDCKNQVIDKDIKVKGNKVYSPETCMMVTSVENAMESDGTLGMFWDLVSPNGVINRVFNQTEFSKIRGLNRGHISAVIRGERKSHKGWKLAD